MTISSEKSGLYLLQLAFLLGILLILIAPATAHAQVNSAIANCEELKDEDTQTQAEICSAHLGCRMVFAIQKTCVKAKQFITNLRAAIGNGVQGFFGRSKDITPDAIFEATLTDKTRVLNTLPATKDMASNIRASVLNARKETLTGTNTAGSSWVYYGDVRNGEAEGVGTRINSDGNVQRGNFKAGDMTGFADVSRSDGSRIVSEINMNLNNGQGAYANANGTVFEGRIANGAMADGKFIAGNGTRFEGIFEKNDVQNGKLFRVDGSLQAEGRFQNFELSVGKQFDTAGNATEVNKPRERELIATANREVEERRQMAANAERQAADERRRADDARVAQTYRDSLQTMNAGQLFAKADELSSQGDKVRSREVLRALISRYPDHALATNAAQQLSSGPQSGATSAQANNQLQQSTAQPGNSGSTSSAGSCAQRIQLVEAIEADFTRRTNALSSSNTIRRLGLLHSVTKAVSEILQPCNSIKAKAYKDTSESTLQTCIGIATTPSVCMLNINWTEGK